MLQKYMSVRLRLTLWNVGVVAFLLIALGVAIRYTTAASMSASLDTNLDERGRRFQEHWRRFDRDRRFPPPWYRPGKPNPFPGPFPTLSNPSDIFARFWPRTLDTEGRPYLPWASDKPWDVGLMKRSARGERVISSTWSGQEHVRVLSLPLYKSGTVVGVMQVAASEAGMDASLASLTTVMLALSPLVLIACGLAGAIMTGRAMSPVRAIAHASSRIGAGNLTERLAVIGHDDFAELAVTINSMLERLNRAFTQLEESIEQQRRFTADASHELRTPLTAIKGNVSLALSAERPASEYRKALEDTNRATDNMNRIVQELLFLARSDAREMPIDRRTIHVPEMLQDAVLAVRASGQPPIVTEAASDLHPLCGDRNLLVRVLTNLLVNALRHTPVNGTITLSGWTEGENLLIKVQDTGEGIAPQHLPHVRERFYRVDASRARCHGGTGLGLAICDCIIEAHGGTMTLTSALGIGTSVVVRLPLAAI